MLISLSTSCSTNHNTFLLPIMAGLPTSPRLGKRTRDETEDDNRPKALNGSNGAAAQSEGEVDLSNIPDSSPTKSNRFIL